MDKTNTVDAFDETSGFSEVQCQGILPNMSKTTHAMGKENVYV